MSKNSETYSSSPLGESSKPKRKGSYIGTILFIVHLALTISLSVALVIAYVTPYIVPEHWGSLTITGHFSPILYIMVLACLNLDPKTVVHLLFHEEESPEVMPWLNSEEFF